MPRKTLVSLRGISNLSNTRTLIYSNAFDVLPKVESNYLVELGELQNVFENYKKANNEFYLSLFDRHYNQQKSIIASRYKTLKLLNEGLLKQRSIYLRDLELATENFRMDSLLAKDNTVAPVQLRNTEAAKLRAELSYNNAIQNIITNQNSQNDLEEQLLILDRNFEQQRNNFLLAFKALQTAFNEWKSKYLIFSPIDGKISFNRSIYEGLNMQIGESLMFVLPRGSDVVCELFTSQNNFGKLKRGQKCIMKFDSYNFEEFGVVEGYVSEISDIPQEVEGLEGSVGFYLVKISFKNGLLTSTNYKIEARFGLTGTAHIVLDDKNLLEKLFLDKFKGLFIYQ